MLVQTFDRGMRSVLTALLAVIGAAFFAHDAHAQGASQTVSQTLVITAPSAALYRAADESTKTSALMQRGRRVETSGAAQNGFVPLTTRAGTTVWLRLADLTPERGEPVVQADDIPVPPQRRRSPAASPRQPASEGSDDGSLHSRLGLERLTFDIGLGGGTYNNNSYTEFDVGLNAYFRRWLAWRNAIFARFTSGADTTYGLDSSVRGILDLSIITAYAGPGYRFASENTSAPFVEAGLVFKIGGLAIGGGIKDILDSWAHSGAPDDQQFLIIIAGGGAI